MPPLPPSNAVATPAVLAGVRDALATGTVVPVLGPGAVADVRHRDDGRPLPADSDALILAINRGQPMAPRLMYEFPRAAMHLELKRGRAALSQALLALYGDTGWPPAALHQWLAACNLPYVIDFNRDTGLQQAYATRPHTLVVGVARIVGGDARYRLYRHDGQGYGAACHEDNLDPQAPVLFKPCGTPWPEPNWIASDADYVDYITELMGGFAVPPFLKQRRQGLRYLLLGLRLHRDTQRMLLADLAYASAQPAGWALLPQASDKERRFCTRLGLDLIDADCADLTTVPENA